MKCDEPDNGAYLIGGEKGRFTLNSSKYYQFDPVNVMIMTGNGSYYLGSYDIGPDSLLTFEWFVPDGIREDNCTLFFSYKWKDKNYNHSDERRFSIVPSSDTPGRLEWKDLAIPVNVTTYFNFTVIGKGGQDITPLSDLSVSSPDGTITLYGFKNGTFSILPKKIGNTTIDLTGKRYGRSIHETMKIIVHRDIASIFFLGDIWNFHPGDTPSFQLFARDHYGKPVDIQNDKITVSVEGSGHLVAYEYPTLDLFCSSAGWIDINASLSIPPLNLKTTRRILVSSYFSKMNLTTSSVTVFSGDTFKAAVSIKRDDGASLDDVDLSWSVSGPGEIVEDIGHIVDIRSFGEGNISVRCQAQYLEEIIGIESTVSSYHPPSHIVLEGPPSFIEVGTKLNLSFHLLNMNGTEYTGEYHVHVSSNDTTTLDVLKGEGWIELSGSRSGPAQLKFIVSSWERMIESTFPIQVVSIPRNLSLNSFEIIRKGETIVIVPIVRDLIGMDMADYGIDLDQEGVTIFDKTGTIEVIGNEIGPGYLEVTVSGYGTNLTERFDLTVIHWADHIEVDDIEISFYENDEVSLNVSLLDRDGLIVPVTFDFISDEGLFTEYSEGVLTLSSVTPGGYPVEITAEYYGSNFEEEIEVTVLERTILTDIILDRSPDGSYRIKAIDQWGNDIVSICEIEIEGDHERIDHSSFRGLSGLIEVKVSYNGTTLFRSVEIPPKEVGKTFPFAILAITGVFVPILLVVILIIRRRKIDPEE